MELTGSSRSQHKAKIQNNPGTLNLVGCGSTFFISADGNNINLVLQSSFDLSIFVTRASPERTKFIETEQKFEI